jgi:hypothetical protein
MDAWFAPLKYSSPKKRCTYAVFGYHEINYIIPSHILLFKIVSDQKKCKIDKHIV